MDNVQYRLYIYATGYKTGCGWSLKDYLQVCKEAKKPGSELWREILRARRMHNQLRKS